LFDASPSPESTGGLLRQRKLKWGFRDSAKLAFWGDIGGF